MGRPIGEIYNFYGNLEIKTEEGKFFWGMDDYDEMRWEEIPKSLYDELGKFDDSLKENSEVV